MCRFSIRALILAAVFIAGCAGFMRGAAAQGNQMVMPEGESAMPLARGALPPREQPAVDTMAIYEKLPPDIQRQLAEEAEYVYNYCETRGMFGMLHDCRCIASKTMDYRILNPEEEKSVVTIGDDMAKDCPNSAGAAGFGYKNCMSSYGSMLRYGLEEFCTCFGNEFSAAYMQQPVSHMQTLQNSFVHSFGTCREKHSEKFR